MMGAMKMGLGFGLWQQGIPAECRDILQRYVDHGRDKFALWPACPPNQLVQQLGYYAHDIILAVEPRQRPVMSHSRPEV